MVESGPFIEYCCELYIHHDVLNIAVATTILVCVALSVAVILALTKRRMFIWLSEFISVKHGSIDHREPECAPSLSGCEDAPCND